MRKHLEGFRLVEQEICRASTNGRVCCQLPPDTHSKDGHCREPQYRPARPLRMWDSQGGSCCVVDFCQMCVGCFDILLTRSPRYRGLAFVNSGSIAGLNKCLHALPKSLRIVVGRCRGRCCPTLSSPVTFGIQSKRSIDGPRMVASCPPTGPNGSACSMLGRMWKACANSAAKSCGCT